MTDKQITIIKEDGSETLCNILFTYYSEEFEHNYVVFAEPGSDEVGAAIFEENSSDQEGGTLKSIDSDEEWTLLEELLEDYAKTLDANNNTDDDEEACSSCCGCGNGDHDGCNH